MIKTVFLVPMRNNTGRDFPESSWRVLEWQLTTAFGGFSARAGVQGTWVSGGRTYHDLSREYTVSLTSWRRLAAWLTIVEWALRRFEQEAIYVEVAGIPEILEP
jgi:hypothetical protein